MRQVPQGALEVRPVAHSFHHRSGGGLAKNVDTRRLERDGVVVELGLKSDANGITRTNVDIERAIDRVGLGSR